MKLLKRAGILCVFLLFFYAQQAKTKTQPGFYFTANCIEAAKNIKVLKLDQARVILVNERVANADNLAVDYLEDFIDYYYLITTQQKSELQRLEKNKEIRINKIKRSAPNSPYFLYAQAEINLHWAMSRIFNQEFVSAAFELRTAYQLLENNHKKFPDFKPNDKNTGMLYAILGTVPENYKWILNIIGMKGDLNGGLKLINDYLQQKEIPAEQILDKQSAEFYYNLLLLNFGDKQDCWKFCETVTADFETNLFSSYLRAFTGIKCAHNNEAIEAGLHRPHSVAYTTFHLMDFYLGQAKLNRLDKDADIYFKKFVTFYKGQNLIKDAYKRLSWYYLIDGDSLKYNTYRGLSRKYGIATTDEDKNAQKESEAGIYPNITLLKARLLFDGAYYPKAEELVKSVNANELKTQYQLIEYYYRFARIMHESNKWAKAIELYNQVIKISVNDNLYFAPNSCLQLGFIYEKLGYKELAKTYYNKVLDYKNYDYKSSLTQKAKAALSKLE